MAEQSAAVREFADVDAGRFDSKITAAGRAATCCAGWAANRAVKAAERRAERAAMR